jgi:catechol 2,3-dioxygenase-like lactoylglutathione lyase family enzyme
MITKIRHTGVVVRDLVKSLNFYEGLGFKLASRQIEHGDFIDQVVGLTKVKVETAKLLSPCGGMLELLKYHSHPINEPVSRQDSNRLGCSHIALQVNDITAVLDIIELKHGSLKCDPVKSADGVFTVAYCYDPEGNIVEIVEEKLKS